MSAPVIEVGDRWTGDLPSFVRFFVANALNDKQLELADRYFSPEYVVHIPGREDQDPGPESFKNIMRTWHRAFPDWCMTIDDLITEGDKVVNRFTTVGTHTGPLFGWAPSGRRFEVHGVVVHRFAEGKVVETWVSDDLPGMLQQLGFLAPVTPAPL